MRIATDAAEAQNIAGETAKPAAELIPEDFLAAVEHGLTHRRRPNAGEAVKIGLDLGTASIVLVVLGADNRPLGTARRFAQVVRDGLVVDFISARSITEELKLELEKDLGVRDGLVVDFISARSITEELKLELEKDLGVKLTFASIAVPPGTSKRDAATHQFVASGAGLEVESVLDEPNAANLVLNIKNGAIVDIGGGTTGVSILRNGKILDTFDEPTGGTHLSLVLAGHYKISFEEAELFKQDPKNAKKIAVLVAPVLQKIGTIIRRGIAGYPVEEIHLVGGTAATYGIEKIISQETGLPAIVSARPIWVTPAGIALGCEAAPAEAIEA